MLHVWQSCVIQPCFGMEGLWEHGMSVCGIYITSWSEHRLWGVTLRAGCTVLFESRGDGRGVTRYRDYEKSQSRRLFSPMPWLTEWFSHPLMQFSGWYSLTMVSIHQIQIGSHRAVLSTPSPPQWFDMRFLLFVFCTNSCVWRWASGTKGLQSMLAMLV